MNYNVEKRFLSLLLALVMVFSMMPHMAPHVHAATKNVNESYADLEISVSGSYDSSNGDVKVDDASDQLTITAKPTSKSNMCGGTDYTVYTTTVTLTNTSGESAKWTFVAEFVDGGSAKIGTDSVTNGGTYTVIVDAGKSIDISVTSQKADATTKLTLTISQQTVKMLTVSFTPAVNGSISVNGEAIVEQKTVTDENTVSYTLAATPAEGYSFAGWYDATNKKYLSADATYTTMFSENMTLTAHFIPTGDAIFGVGNARFADLNAAAQSAAGSTSHKTVVLLKDATLPAGDYTIPVGVTLLIPRDEAGTIDGATPPYITWAGAPSIYRTLYMAEGAKLTVNGVVCLAAQHTGDQHYNGSPTGPVGRIVMAEGSTITLQKGATLYAWGYISGAGAISAQKDAAVHEYFQLGDFRGGSATVGNFLKGVPSMIDNEYRVLPMSQYYLQNVEVPLTYEPGAKCYAYMSAALSVGTYGATLKIIGNEENFMFRLTKGTLTKDFDESTGRTIFTLTEGEVSASPMTISLSSYSIKSQNYFMPIPGHITINVTGGSTITMNQDLALLPGSELYIDSTSQGKLAAGVSVVVYDWDDWRRDAGAGFAGSLGMNYTAIPYAPGLNPNYDPTAGREKDATIRIDGYVDASEGYVYTTAGGANIYGTGEVKTKATTAGVTYQASQSDVYVTYHSIDIKPAVLQNKGNTDHPTTESGTAGTYFWNASCNMWTLKQNENHTSHYDSTGDGNHNCDFCGAENVTKHDDKPEDKNHDCDECGQDAGTCKDGDKSEGILPNHECDTETGCDFWRTGANAHQDGDEDTDHVCDYCGDPVAGEECYDADNDGNHQCDECLKDGFTRCQDANKDHKCDYDTKCPEWNFDENAHASKDGGHVCDYCKKGVTDCVDKNTDHKCDYDGCTAFIGAHEDYGDNDHFCDYCKDENDKLTDCVDVEPKDHKCDVCGVTLDSCIDTDEDHYCDYVGCLEETSKCTDVNPGDHFCDYAGCKKDMGTVCGDDNNDHMCDICGDELSKCSDKGDDGDHNCDTCGAENVTSCFDKTGDNDHKCDDCGAENITSCADADNDGDHKCNECGKENITTCSDRDADGNHDCDECGAQNVTTCVDSLKDHVCDSDSTCAVYNTGVNAHKDSTTDDDHICDYCQDASDVLEKCKDCTWTYTDLGNGTHDANCSICGALMEDGEGHDYNDAGLCPCGNTAEAKIGATYYYTFQLALDEAKDGETITILKSIALTEVIELSEKLTINAIDGVTVTTTATDLFTVVAGGELTLGTGLVVNSNTSILWATNGGVINVDGAVLNSTSTQYALAFAEGSGVINVKSGKLISSGNSVITAQFGATVNISGGEIETTSDAGFCAAFARKAVINVTGGTIKSTTGYGVVAVTDGTVIISCGTIHGGVLAHENTNANVTISGGTIYGHVGVKDGASLVVTGGAFEMDVTEYCDDKHHTIYSEATGLYKYGLHTDCDWEYTANGDGSHDATCTGCGLQMIDDEEHIYDVNGACTCGNTAEAKIGDTYYCFFVDAVAAAKDGQTVIMCKDVTLTEKLTVESQQVWNLGDYTLKTANGDENYSLVVKGDLTIKDGNIVVNGWFGIGVLGSLTVNGGNFGYYGYNDYLLGNWGTLVINNGSFNGQYCCVNNFAGTTTINDGTFVTAATDSTGEYDSYDLLADSGLTVKGGSFSKDVTEYCDDKHHTIYSEATGLYEYGLHTDCDWEYTDNGDGSHDATCTGCGLQMIDNEKHSYDVNGACTCGNTAEAKIGDTYYCFFVDAVAAAKDGQTVIMCKDVTLTEKLTVESQQVWDLGSNTLKVANGDENYMLVVKGDLTIEGGKIVVNGLYGVGVMGTMTVNGGEFTYDTYNDYLIGNWGTLVINGGSFNGQYCCVNNFMGNTTINGGSFVTAATDSTGEYDSYDLLADSGLVVKGGSFSKDMTEYCEYMFHTAKPEGGQYYVYGQHVYVQGHCACGHVQDLKISLVIKAEGSDDNAKPVGTIKYGSDYQLIPDFSGFGDCYTMGDISVLVGGQLVDDYTYVDGVLTIEGKYVTGDIEIVVIAVQRHTVGKVVMENYVAPSFDADGSYDLVVYCDGCHNPIKTTHYEIENSRLNAVAQIGNTKYESLEEAIAAAKKGDAIVLLQKVVVDSEKVWDLTGITLHIADVTDDYGLIIRGDLTINGGYIVANGFYGIGVTETGKLTVNGGNFSVAGDNDYLIGSYGAVEINGGTFAGQYSCVNGFAGTVTINGGSFATAEYDYTGDYASADLFVAYENGAKLTISGGSFSKNVIYTDDEDRTIADHLKEGYCVAENDGTYTVAQHIAGQVVVENVKDATCTENGSYDNVTYCVHCEKEMDRQTVSVDMLEHTAGRTEIENKTDATCTTAGSYENVTYCTCGAEMSRDTIVIPAIGHTAGEAVIENVVDATCTAGGSYDVATYCVTCHAKLSSKTITTEALGHQWVPGSEKPATCTEKGHIPYSCACGATKTEEIPATGHTAGEAVIEKVVDATCIADGSYDVATYCVTCDAKLSSKTITTDALGHQWVPHTAQPATCTEAGWGKNICSVCNVESEKIVIPATGHTAGAAVTENYVAPNCTKAGSYDVVVYCACGHEISRTTTTVAATGHKYVTQTVAPTCVQRGYTVYTCACGYSYVADYTVATGHSYVEQITTAPTCTEKGVKTHTCSSCGHTKTEEIAAVGHSWGRDVIVPPTCIDGGYTIYTCFTCGDTYTSNLVGATGHTWNEGVVDFAPTCTASGRMTFTCACGATRSELIDAIGHDYQTAVTLPTCTDGGYDTHTCANCGDVYVDGHVAANGHSWDDGVVTNPTCTADGYTTYTCSVCGTNRKDHQVTAPGHDYKDTVYAPSCTEGGYTTHTCSVCGHTYSDAELEATGHDYTEEVTVEPGCETVGVKVHTCVNCGDVQEERIPENGHNYEETVVPPTCTTIGISTHTCSNCGEFYNEVIPATGHSYEAVVTAPTCTEKGYTTYTCAVCNHSYKGDEVDTIEHSWDQGVVTAPTCTEEGYTTYTCSECGKTHDADKVAATGHTMGKIVAENYKAPTCTENGSYDMVIYCAVCEGEFCRVEWSIEATGHSYVVTTLAPTCTEKGGTTYTCACGDTYTEEIPATGHSHEAVVTAPTCTEKGATTYTCACGDTYTEEIPATGHSHEAVVTAPTCTEKGYTTYTCHCGDSYVADEVDAKGHTEGEAVKENVEDDSYDEVVYCTECGEELSRTTVVIKPDVLYGDVNRDGVVDTKDANLVCSYYNELIDLEEDQLIAADVNGDGIVDTKDANLICSYYNELIEAFPVESDIEA